MSRLVFLVCLSSPILVAVGQNFPNLECSSVYRRGTKIGTKAGVTFQSHPGYEQGTNYTSGINCAARVRVCKDLRTRKVFLEILKLSMLPSFQLDVSTCSKLRVTCEDRFEIPKSLKCRENFLQFRNRDIKTLR